MLAVTGEERGAGLGQRLKRFQRDLLIRRGVDVMYWTFDPLVARNAHLNLNRLGARIEAYAPDYYGADTDSELHSGLGTDRFIVEWRLREARTRRALAGSPPVADYARFDATPIVDSAMRADGSPDPCDQPLPPARDVRVEVPVDVQAVKRADPATAWRWREVTRRAFLHYLGAGYAVRGIYRSPDGLRAFYLLSRGRA
jgi:predicted GNAT superfamily acetyltransferase